MAGVHLSRLGLLPAPWLKMRCLQSIELQGPGPSHRDGRLLEEGTVWSVECQGLHMPLKMEGKSVTGSAMATHRKGPTYHPHHHHELRSCSESSEDIPGSFSTSIFIYQAFATQRGIDQIPLQWTRVHLQGLPGLLWICLSSLARCERLSPAQPCTVTLVL